jgi:hypothetical protein
MEQIPLCTNCKRVKREASDFIGDDGKQRKTCKKCMDKGLQLLPLTYTKLT